MYNGVPILKLYVNLHICEFSIAFGLNKKGSCEGHLTGGGGILKHL